MGIPPTRKRRVIPAGAYIEEWLEDQGMTQGELASDLDVPRTHLNQVIKGRKRLTENLAVKLESVTGTPADYWLRMESAYQVARVSEELVDAHRAAYRSHKEALQRFPVVHLRRRGVLSASWHQPEDVIGELLAFFKVGDVSRLLALPDTHAFAAAYRQSTAHTVVPEAVVSWLALGDLQAELVDLECGFNPSKLEGIVPRLRGLTHLRVEDSLPAAQTLLSDVGVRLVFVEDLPGARANGATRLWRGAPLIQISDRNKRDDIFWFTLFHEVAHVLNDDISDLRLSVGDTPSDEAERQADHWAGSQLIPAEFNDLMGSVGSVNAVAEVAKEVGITPGIVVGRLVRDGNLDHWVIPKFTKRVDFGQLQLESYECTYVCKSRVGPVQVDN